MKNLIQKLNDKNENYKIWDNLTEAEQILYLSMRKVQNKIEKQQQSMVMEMEELVKNFEPFKVKKINLPTKSPIKQNNDFTNQSSLMSLNLEDINISKNNGYGEKVITLEVSQGQTERFVESISELENPKLTEKVEEFFYAKESVKKWIDSQDVINKKVFYLDDSIAKLSPALYAQFILEDEMLAQGLLFLSNQNINDLTHEYQAVIQHLLDTNEISLEEKIMLDQKLTKNK